MVVSQLYFPIRDLFVMDRGKHRLEQNICVPANPGTSANSGNCKFQVLRVAWIPGPRQIRLH